MEKLYTMKEASEILGVHVRTLQKWDREGKYAVLGLLVVNVECLSQRLRGF